VAVRRGHLTGAPRKSRPEARQARSALATLVVVHPPSAQGQPNYSPSRGEQVRIRRPGDEIVLSDERSARGIAPSLPLATAFWMERSGGTR
jgi:hypothetical protein